MLSVELAVGPGAIFGVALIESSSPGQARHVWIKVATKSLAMILQNRESRERPALFHAIAVCCLPMQR